MLLFYYTAHISAHFYDRDRQNELLLHYKNFMITWKKREKQPETIQH